MYTNPLLETRQLFESFFPEPTLRARCLSWFAERIRNAHRNAPGEWTVRLHIRKPKQIYLIVGHLVPFSVVQGNIWMALDQQQLEAHPQYTEYLNEAQSWKWRIGRYAYFKLVPSRNGCYFPDADPSQELWPRVWKLNSTFVKRIGELKRKLHPQSRGGYEPAIIEYLRQELKTSLPEPATDSALPEEIEGTVFYEGARKQISVNAYERNQGARRICLQHYGTRCTVCLQDMSEIYGTVADGLIHVHHLKPLSEVQEGYEVDAIRDLRPVCPNCHAVIHRRKPPYTIEEVKNFLNR